ncbi:MAG: PAS domain S-box protein [Methanomicrobiales archaeon]|nr:PAS domain S-box protein [Methanomicrobiales archaeon]
MIPEELRILKLNEELFFRFKSIPTVFNDGAPGVTVILEDITEQKHAEEEIRRREITYRTLVEEINDVILNIDENGIISYVSPRAREVLGYEPEQMAGRCFSDYMAPGESEKLGQQILSDGRAVPFSCIECRMHACDGRDIVLEISGRPIFDEIEDLAGYRMACRDVTERHAARRRMAQWKSFLHSIVQNIPGMVMVRELKTGTFIFFNHAAEEFFGRPSEELAGMRPGDLFDAGLAARIADCDRQALATGAAAVLPDVRLPGGNGGSRILDFRIVPIADSRGLPKYLLAIAEDVSERRRSGMLARAQRDLAASLCKAATVADALPAIAATIREVSEMDAGILVMEGGETPLFSGSGLVSRDTCRMALERCRAAGGDEQSVSGTAPRSLPAAECPGMVPEARSVAFVPVLHDGALGGVIVAASSAWGDVPVWSLHALESVAGQMSSFIARLQAQESLRRERDRAQGYLDLAGVMLAVVDADGRVVRMNKAGCALLGYAEEDLLGRDWFDTFVPGGVRERMRANFAFCMQGQLSFPSYDVSAVLSREGEEKTIFWHNTLLQEPGGRITGMVASGEDITGRDITRLCGEERHSKTG